MKSERLKRIANVRISNVDKKTVEGQVPVKLCNYTDVYYNERITGALDFMVATASYGQCTTFGLRPGDVVLTKDSETAEDIGVSALVAEEVPGLVCGYHLAVVRAHPERANGRYLRWVLASGPARQQMSAAATGVTRFGLRSEALGDLPIPMPSLLAQSAIANFLDRETEQIKALIAAKQRMVELLEEQRASWLYGVLMKQRRLRETVPLKSVARWVEGPGIMAADFRDEGVPLLRIRNLIGDTVDLAGCGFVPPVLVQERWNHLRVRAGELLISGSARSGSPVVVPPEADGAVPYTGLIRVWPSAGRIERDYLRLFLASPVFNDQIDRLKTGVGLQHWGPSHLAQITVPLPPISEQLSIAAEFASRERRRREVVQCHVRQIKLLEERRQGLITGAVTGRFEISGAP